MGKVLYPRDQLTIPCASGDAFAVRRVWCVGRNYAEHIREMGNDEREPPFFFSKPGDRDAIITGGNDLRYPPHTSDYHHEVELVVAIWVDGTNIAVEDALGHVYGYGVGLDMTRRDIQAGAKKAGRPWEMAKGFDSSAAIGMLTHLGEDVHPTSGAITLTVNGQERQRGDLRDQIWNVAEIVSNLSQFVAIGAGDLIMTGTPAGVGPVVRGDVLEGAIEGVGTVRATIV